MTKPKTDTNEPKAPNNGAGNAGADGSKGTPQTGDQGPKWPDGGKKGEDE